jgi:PIN domain nuclease of toxin-antitoxin system
VKLLLDTHAFLWFTLDDPRLSGQAQDLMREQSNELVLSVASCWEIAIKLSIGKYEIPGDFESFMLEQIETNQLVFQPITIPHLAVMKSLPFFHRDPFDRLLIAQALAEAVPILSVDKEFDAYGVRRIW